MRAGRLRDRVRIEKPVQVRNQTSGSISNNWQIVAKRSANIMPLSAIERNNQSAETIETNTIIHLRYDAALKLLDGDWQVVDDRTERVYEIESFDPITVGMKDLKIRCVHRSK